MIITIIIIIDVAEEVLNRCVISDPDPRKTVDGKKYSVILNYKFIEDFAKISLKEDFRYVFTQCVASYTILIFNREFPSNQKAIIPS